MIGLINAIGSVDSARQSVVQKGTGTSSPVPTERVPILSAEQAANRVLHSAVEAIEFQQSAQEQAVKSGEDMRPNDRAGPANDTVPTEQLPGRMLDVTG